MIWSRITRISARNLFSELLKAERFMPADLTPDYRRLRTVFKSELPPFSDTMAQNAGVYDIETGLRLYQILLAEGFNVRAAADDGIWRHLSLCVIPDIVEQRWPKRQDDRFWRNRSRIWLRTIWWVTHLAWQGSVSATRGVMRGFTTDMVVQLIERPGRGGFRVDLSRALFMERSRHGVKQDDFRAMMKLNTARLIVIAPELVDGGVDGYAIRLREAVTGSRNTQKQSRENKRNEFA